jgi:hypothetical protein
MHICQLGATKWDTLQNFLDNATDAMHKSIKDDRQQAHHQSTAPPQKRSLMGAIERLCPAFVMAISVFVAHNRVQRLLDPKTPHPILAITRYLSVVLASLTAAALGILALHALMEQAGHVVCVAADAVQAAADRLPWEGSCLPMAPDGWLLPLGFGFLSGMFEIGT